MSINDLLNYSRACQLRRLKEKQTVQKETVTQKCVLDGAACPKGLGNRRLLETSQFLIAEFILRFRREVTNANAALEFTKRRENLKILKKREKDIFI